MSVKIFKNLVKPNKLVLTLLIFGAYFYITNINTLLLTITQYNITIQKTRKKVKDFMHLIKSMIY